MTSHCKVCQTSEDIDGTVLHYRGCPNAGPTTYVPDMVPDIEGCLAAIKRIQQVLNEMDTKGEHHDSEIV